MPLIDVTQIVAHLQVVNPEQVRVILFEVPPEHWAVGGQSKAAQKAAFAQQKKEVSE